MASRFRLRPGPRERCSPTGRIGGCRRWSVSARCTRSRRSRRCGSSGRLGSGSATAGGTARWCRVRYGSSSVASRSVRDTFARSIVEEADRLNVLIGNLLDLSRLTADSVELRLQPVGIDDVIPPVLDSLPFRDAPIVVETPHITPVVSAEPVLLDRILTNLLDNARRWSPDVATVTIRAETPGDGTVRLRVIDQGPGRPRDQRERVFQPFQRLGDGGTSGPGSGLGLAVARGFARAMGGDVQLTDTPGGGTTATIVLKEADPAADAELAAATEHRP